MSYTKKIAMSFMAALCIIMLSACTAEDILSANVYACVESVSDTQLVLDTGVWEKDVFTSNQGETVVAPSKIIRIRDMQGNDLQYTDLQEGDILDISFQTNVKTSVNTISIQLVQKNLEGN